MTHPAGFGDIVERLRRSTVLIGDGTRSGTGSGVMIDALGTIATNAHVVRSQRAAVQLYDGSTHSAVLTAHDAGRDLALLSIGGESRAGAVIGDSRALRAGDFVTAVGNPLGFIGAVTVGVVHGTGKVRGLGNTEWIQSELRLAPGNSGGPLANAAGEIVGLNTMIAGRLALAVPGEVLARFVRERQSRETIGVVIQPVSVSIGGAQRAGLLLLEVAAGGAASGASLMPGDILVGVNGTPLGSPDDLAVHLEGHAERVLRVQFLRGDRSTIRTTSILLGTRRSRAA